MAGQLRVALEIGPKERRVVAVAPDWPGLERGARSAEAAFETLRAYLPRYAPVAERAGMGEGFLASTALAVVEQYAGTGSTDFWGISFAFSSIDRADVPAAALERELALLGACWDLFDDIRRHVSAALRAGPRGGGRDRDRVVRHVLANEQDWAKKLGMPPAPEGVVTDDEGVRAWRARYCAAIRAFHAEEKMARTWPLRYLIRHTAYHVLDHSWEMQDKDLSGEPGAPAAPAGP